MKFAIFLKSSLLFNPIQGCSWMGGKKAPLPKICHTYPTMRKLGSVTPYLKKIQKLYKSRDRPTEFCRHRHFSPGIRKFCYVKKSICRFYLDTRFLILLNINKHDHSFDDVRKNGYPRPS